MLSCWLVYACVLVRMFSVAPSYLYLYGNLSRIGPVKGLTVDFFFFFETDSSVLASQVLNRQVCISPVPSFFLDVGK